MAFTPCTPFGAVLAEKSEFYWKIQEKKVSLLRNRLKK